MIRLLILITAISGISSCYYAKEYIDVSANEPYRSIIGTSIKSEVPLLAQAFDQLTSTDNLPGNECKEVVDILNVPGLNNRHLKWTVQIPTGETFKIVKVIKTELAGGFTLYYQVQPESIQRLICTITLLRVTDINNLSNNAGLAESDFRVLVK